MANLCSPRSNHTLLSIKTTNLYNIKLYYLIGASGKGNQMVVEGGVGRGVVLGGGRAIVEGGGLVCGRGAVYLVVSQGFLG